MNDESRPVKAAPEVSTPIKTVPILADLPAATLTANRKGWADVLIRRATTSIPTYGSAAWMALPETSPERIAAVVVAAEAWARDGDYLAERLRYELTQSRRTVERLDAETHRAAVAPLTRARNVTSYADRRRQRLLSINPRSGDHPGGSVRWDAS